MLPRSDEELHGGGLRDVVALIRRSHERPAQKLQHQRDLARLFRALWQNGVVDLVPRPDGRRGRIARLAIGLQRDFSLHHALSLWLVGALDDLDAQTKEEGRATEPAEILALCEAILDNPSQVLKAQAQREKQALLADLKNDGVPYEERKELVDAVTWPKPLADWIYANFEKFGERHPWVAHTAIRPKGVVREMAEAWCTFDEYVRELGLQTVEGVLLRYLMQVYKVLLQNVPEDLKSDAFLELVAWLRAVLARVDRSLLDEWQRMKTGQDVVSELPEMPPDPRAADKALKARARVEALAFLQALAANAIEDAAAMLAADEDGKVWTAEALLTYKKSFENEGSLLFDHRSRLADACALRAPRAGVWEVTLVLHNAEGPTGDTLTLTAQADLEGLRLHA
jgi:hypothetical protein